MRDTSMPWTACSHADEAIRLRDEPSNGRWRHPLASDGHHVLFSHPTGDRATLSDVDGHLVLSGLGEEIAERRNAETFQLLPDVGLRQLGGVAGEDNADRVADLERAVDC